MHRKLQTHMNNETQNQPPAGRELPKHFVPAEIEKLAADCWTGEKLFHAKPTDPGAPFAVVIPPPNVTGALHLGHALNNTLQDIIIRWRRMCGDNAVWVPGTDHAGIATQAVVEKRLHKEGKRRTDFTREQFVERVQAWKDEYEARIISQLKAMGCSCDFDRLAFTMDESRAKAVREAFFQLFKDGLIYRGKRLVNWDPVLKTAVADDEVVNEEVDGFFYYLKYPLDDGSGHVTVATTRPETMLGDTAVAMNPKDPRAAHYRGKRVRLPIVDRVIPIIEDEYVVLPVSLGGDPSDTKAQFATGFLKVTPAHDPNDYDIGQRHQLPIINVMAPEASISLDHGWAAIEGHQKDNAELGRFLGKGRDEARTAVIHWFRDNGLLEDQKPYKHTVGHSERSAVPIEPYLSDQWYLKVTDERLAKRANAVLDKESGIGGSPMSSSDQDATKKVTFHPPRYAKTYETWHDNIRDWCISRQLWWGHRIPVWHRRMVIETQEDADELGQSLAHSLVLQAVEDRFDNDLPNFAWRIVDSEGKSTPGLIERAGTYDVYLCLRDEFNTSRWESNGFRRDPDVLDTWFSSALWPLSTLGWPEQSTIDDPQSSLNTWNPTSLLCTAREIITLWVSRMAMFNLYFRGCVPFKDVYIHAVIQDGEGRKMSKSLGNGVDPLDIIASHGADAMRYTLASMATNTQDVRLPVELDSTTGKNTSSKFDIGRSFAVKLWNASRFVLMQLENGKAATSPEPIDELKWSMADRWIVSRFNRTVEEVSATLGSYRFDQYAKAVYDFFWRDFCDWYVEFAKPQMKDASRQAQTAQILASVLDGALRLLHPVIPHITEVLWWKLNEVCPRRGLPGRIDCPENVSRLIRAPFPSVGGFLEASEHIFPRIQELVSVIRNVRNDYKVDARKSVTVHIMAPGDSARQIMALQPAIEMMATCRLAGVAPNVAPPAGAVRATADKCELFIEGLVDVAADAARVARQRDELEKKISTLKGRLSNEGYIARAPAKLVAETKEQLQAAEAELAKLP